MSKRFFVRTDSGDQLRYRNGFIRLDCGLGREIRLVLAREHDPAGLPPVQIDANGHRVDLRSQSSSRDFDMRSGLLSADMLDSIADVASIEISGIDQGRSDKSGGGIAVSMVGFSGAYAKLQKSCDVSGRSAIALAPWTGPLAVPAAATPSELPKTLELTGAVAAEQRLRLDSLDSTKVAGCYSTAPKVRILEQPQHGTLTIENGLRDACQRDVTFVFYEPISGYTGADSVTLYVLYPLGTTATRHYSIEVK